jgi:lysozyme
MKRRDLSLNRRRINARGLALIKMYEGLSLRSYRCPAGKWTIGYGHTDTALPEQEITEERADALLQLDLARFELAVARQVKVPLNDNQFAALVSLIFNIGELAFARSTLLKLLNAGELQAVPAEFMRWTKVAGADLPGLVRRRTAEVQLWERIG